MIFLQATMIIQHGNRLDRLMRDVIGPKAVTIQECRNSETGRTVNILFLKSGVVQPNRAVRATGQN
ncbi:MAG: hypothetical protein COB90_08675 [Hyphomicrobiales bacterium]|nr:MAG: hypothetical protein COB90_08675 [Hyphomicrobiales bacterium]